MIPPRINTTQSTVTEEEVVLKKKEEIIKKVYRLYNDDQKRSFTILKIEKLISSRAAALQLGIVPRTAQRWWRHWEEHGEVPTKKSTCNIGRESEFTPEHEEFVLNHVDDNPSTVADEVMENLLKK
jgi:transposase-like protein